VHARTGRLAVRLPQRAAGFLAHAHPRHGGARLHGRRGQPVERFGHHRGSRVTGQPPVAGRYACAGGGFGDAAVAVRRAGRHRRRLMKWLLRLLLLIVLLGVLLLAGLFFGGSHRPTSRAMSKVTAATLKDPALIARGEYLATVGDCAGCHTAQGGARLAGGRSLATPFGNIPVPNITPDRDTGLGDWSFEDFWQALHAGKGRRGELLYPAFSYTSYTRVTRDDGLAMFVAAIAASGASAGALTGAGFSVQRAQEPGCLAHAVFQGGCVQARSRAVAAVESRRLSGAGPGSLQ